MTTPTHPAFRRSASAPGTVPYWIGLLLLIVHAYEIRAAEPDFSRDVRPILSRHCFKCHGPDEPARKGGLRLDRREDALAPAKSGAIAIRPGQSGTSELVKRVESTDPDSQMPPPSAQKGLSNAEREILRQWIQSGAVYQQHWAFVRPEKPPIPSVQARHRSHNPIDAFVLARLENTELSPTEPADKFTLARRVALDLIGLPPDLEWVNAFVDDNSPGAYERYVDRLLASPHYGERWARRWMDLARYADTNGYEKDRQRTVWPWRDWVIHALNQDLPFDQFTIEQLAGDLLPNPTRDQLVATAFHRHTMLNEEGGIDPLEFRFNALVDRVNTTGTIWTGLTLGCAQCHTHKYDPIPHREYYQWMAYFNNSDEPDLELPNADEEETYRRNLAEADRRLADLPNRFPVGAYDWHAVAIQDASAEFSSPPRRLPDGSVLFSGSVPEKDTYTLVLDTQLTNIVALRLETLTEDTLPRRGPGRTAHGNFVLGEIIATIAPLNAPERTEILKFTHAQADVEQAGYPAKNLIDGNPATGWAVDAGPSALNRDHVATLKLAAPAGFPSGSRVVLRLPQISANQHLVGRPKIQLGTPQSESESNLARRRSQRIEQQEKEWLVVQRQGLGAWTPLIPVEATSNLPRLQILDGGAILASGDITKSDTYSIKARNPVNGIRSIRLEVLPHPSLPRQGPGLTYYEGPKGDFFLGEFRLKVDGQAQRFISASHSYAKNNFGSQAAAELAIDGDPQTGWSTAAREGERHEAVFNLESPLPAGAELEVQLQFGRHYACSLGHFRLSFTPQADARASQLGEKLQPLILRDRSTWSETERQSVRNEFLLAAPELAAESAEIRKLRQPRSPLTTLIIRERPSDNPRPTHRHQRGEYLQPMERVDPALLSTLRSGSEVGTSSRPRNRYEFARWLVSRENPLAARVQVNRHWQAFFGIGLVRTVDDFGFQGEMPSHPELLDWLAVEFMDQGWSQKKLHKLIVMSATYQQSSRTTELQRSKDPSNRWLSRGPRVRIEAEMIRDAFLQVSGLLSPKIGGKSVYPPQSAGITEDAFGGSGWPTSAGPDRYRRGLYTFMKRTAPFAMFNTFDAPTGEACVARREVSNTPLQALTLLNDVLLVDASRSLGRSLAARKGADVSRIEVAFQQCLTRPPTADETATLVQFVERQRQRLTDGTLNARAIAGEENVELAVWTTLARALMNLDEMITKS